jgi:predicted AAA+ superfamily ATPase
MIKSFRRTLQLPHLLKKKSFFLLGPRATGKTSLIRAQLPEARVYDLLNPAVYGDLVRRPQLIAEELKAKPAPLIVIDEIQKLPLLLDEAHRLIENTGVRFLLTGSSARKLKHGGANLLGGRAWEAALYPLTSHEIQSSSEKNLSFDELRYFNQGGIPHIYLAEEPREELKSYVNLYLREEIQAEASRMRVDLFARFLDVMALQNGEELHYQGLSSDAGVPARTLQNYVQMLEDTLVGFQLPAFLATRKRKAITRSKFYFFDIGVVNQLAHRGDVLAKSDVYGKCFEHFLLLEIRAYLGYSRKDVPLAYWRTGSGFEVDCIIGDQWALEFKATDQVNERHLRGLKALGEEGKIRHLGIVSNDSARRIVDGVMVFPWREFLSELWAGKIT